MATTSEAFSRYDHAIEQASTAKRLDKLWQYIEIEYDNYTLTEDEYNHLFNVVNSRLDDLYTVKEILRR